MNKINDQYKSLRWLAFMAAAVASIATYDLSYHLTPDIVVWDFNFRPLISLGYAVLLDGLFLVLDNRLAYMKTEGAREWTIRFMIVIWLIMSAVNVIDGMLNKTIDSTILGRAGFLLYAVKLIALFYLAYYAYIHYDDPETKKEIMKRKSAETRAAGINAFMEKYSSAFASAGAKVTAMYEIGDFIFEETGRHPRDIFGVGWEAKLSEMAGITWDAASLDTGNTPSNDAGNGPEKKGHKKPPVVTGKSLEGLLGTFQTMGKDRVNAEVENVPAMKEETRPGF